MKSIILAALIAAGAYGAHWFTTQQTALVQEPAGTTAIAELATEIPVDPFGGSQAQKEFDALTRRAKDAETQIGRLMGESSHWQAEAKKYQDNLAVIVEDRDKFMAEVTRLDALMARTTDESNRWKAIALQNKSMAEQNAAIAQQNAQTAAQWQNAAQSTAVPYNPFTAYAQRQQASAGQPKPSKSRSSTISAADRARLDQMTRDISNADAAVTQERQLNNITRELRK